MERLYLTEFDQELIDPTGKARSYLRSLKDGAYTPVPGLFYRADDSDGGRQYYLNKYLKLLDGISKQGPKHRDYVEWTLSLVPKYGPQGGHFKLAKVEDKYVLSYELAKRRVEFKNTRIGRDYLLRLIDQAIDRYGYPQVDYFTRGVTGTSSCLPVMSVKGEFLAETVGMRPWRHVGYDLPGQRRQRQKERGVNQDANSNVRYIECQLTAVRNWLTDYLSDYFQCWCDPRTRIKPRVYDFMRKPFVSVETDFTNCDDAFSLSIVTEIILPIYERLLPPMEFIRFASFIEELFYQPIYMGEYALTGLHNLLSGQAITNDFETIYDVALIIGALIASGIPVTSALKLACGDDISVIVRKMRDALALRDNLIDEATLNGHFMSVEKSRTSSTSIQFCRTMYYPSARQEYYGDYHYFIGAYPGVFTMNTIINPERHLSDEAEIVKATLQRLDNLHGSPEFEPVTQMIGKQLKRKTVRDDEIQVAQSYDWWERVYGTHWTLLTSPSYQVLVKSNLW